MNVYSVLEADITKRDAQRRLQFSFLTLKIKLYKVLKIIRSPIDYLLITPIVYVCSCLQYGKANFVCTLLIFLVRQNIRR